MHQGSIFLPFTLRYNAAMNAIPVVGRDPAMSAPRGAILSPSSQHRFPPLPARNARIATGKAALSASFAKTEFCITKKRDQLILGVEAVYTRFRFTAGYAKTVVWIAMYAANRDGYGYCLNYPKQVPPKRTKRYATERKPAKMRKKLILVCLVLALVFSFTSESAGDSFSFSNQDSASEFVYRDGIKFGMTIGQVKEQMPNKPAEEGWTTFDNQNVYCVKYQGERVMDSGCDITYYFPSEEGGLTNLKVNIYSTHDDYMTFEAALTQKYGNPDYGPIFDAFDLVTFTGTDWFYRSGVRHYSISHTMITTPQKITHVINYSSLTGSPANPETDNGL